MATKLLPGKGGHFHLNGDVLKFFHDVMTDIGEHIGDETLNDALDDGKARELFMNLKGAHGWTYANDKFGEKCYREMDWQTGTYRITVVLMGGRDGDEQLKLDVRNWYDPEA